MVNGHRPLVIGTIKNYIDKPEVLEDVTEDEEERDIVSSFLQRRLGYLYIEYGRLEEAQMLFTELLSDPRSKDFALQELEYIESLKEEE